MPIARWPGTPYGPVVELGYPYEVGPEFRYDQARYDTTGRYGPWWQWRRLECDVRSASIVRGASSPSQRASSATASLVLSVGDDTLAPWYIDPTTGLRPNRANLPLRVGIVNLDTPEPPEPIPPPLLLEPFDNLTDNAWTLSGPPTIVAGRTGTAMRIAGAVTRADKTFTADEWVTFGFAWQTTTAGATRRTLAELWDAGYALRHVQVTYEGTTDQRIAVWFSAAGGTQYGISTTLIPVNTWAYVEVRVRVHPTDGQVELRINGATQFAVTGVQTRNGTNPFSAFRLATNISTFASLYDDHYLDVGEAAPFRGDFTIPPGPPTVLARAAEPAVSWLFTGWVDYLTEVDAVDELTLTVVASDGYKHLALLNQAEQAAQGSGEAAGARIGRILDRAAWQAGRDLNMGTFALQATTLAQPALEEIFLVADTEGGVVWIDTEGVFRFGDRDWLRSKAARTDWRVGDGTADPDGICASSIVTSADDMDIENVVGVSRVGGTASWVEDSASIAKYGRHSWSRFDLPYASDADTATILAFQLADRVAREYHAQAVVLSPLVEAEAWACVLGVDLYDTVWLNRRRVASYDALGSVIGIDHTFGPSEFVTVLSLGPRIRQTNARYDVDVYDVAKYSGT